MQDVQLLDSSGAAIAALKPMRARLLANLSDPRSAAELSKALGVPRQKVNYHLRALESAGLVEVAEERAWGGLTERRMIASARGYVVSPAALGPAAADPDRSQDRLSATYLLALAARVLREVGHLIGKATAQRKRLATLSLDAEIRFRSAAERAAFTRELVAGVTELVGRYHDAGSAHGRPHRLVLVAHPHPVTLHPGAEPMSVNTDPDTRRHWVQSEVEVAATPEEVWQAIATGPGITAWFMPTRFEKGPDGTPVRVVTDFGEHGEARNEITAWDPPRSFHAQGAAGTWGPGAPPVATEWHVEARDGGTCVVRVVHSLFADSDDWDGQLADTGPGWAQFFATLKEHLEGATRGG